MWILDYGGLYITSCKCEESWYSKYMINRGSSSQLSSDQFKGMSTTGWNIFSAASFIQRQRSNRQPQYNFYFCHILLMLYKYLVVAVSQCHWRINSQRFIRKTLLVCSHHESINLLHAQGLGSVCSRNTCLKSQSTRRRSKSRGP